MKKIKGIKSKKTSELISELKKTRQKLRALNFDLVTKKIKNHQEITHTRKKIAMILTILSERELEEMEKIATTEEQKEAKTQR